LSGKLSRRGKDREINFESARSNAEKLEPEKAEAILSWDFNQLRKKLQNGDVSCTEALRAYQRSALSSTERTNCVCMFVETPFVLVRLYAPFHLRLGTLIGCVSTHSTDVTTPRSLFIHPVVVRTSINCNKRA
ncbi:hypothetical protein ANCDUO_16166, partial [Ancylostoma duodenale]